MNKTLTSIGIVGGGTAGWMTATLFSTVLRGTNIKITLVESPEIATVGVGESTVPSMMDFLQTCQIDLKEFIKSCSASFKLGIRFDDWHEKGEAYFHPFGKIGKDINGFDFYQAWLKSLANGKETRWVDFSPSAIMAENNRFMLRGQHANDWVLSSYAHAFHLDAIKLAKYLRDVSIQRNVQRIEATVNNVVLSKEGFIDKLELENGDTLNCDFYIDCTGFKGLLIEDALKVGYQDWSHYLPCNRAVTVQTSNAGKPVPYTVAKAQEAGWTWTIPLQHRTGNGYVFSSRFCSDEQAISTLLNNVKGDVTNHPRVIPFVTGRRNKVWHKNCVAIGLAGGFLEPLESTAIHLIYKSLVHLLKHFPDRDFEPHVEEAFNQKINRDYAEIRDFIIMHYCTSNRTDSEFWKWCDCMDVPDSLAKKISLFRERGQIEYSTEQFFSSDSWCSILEGMKIRPKKYHPLMDAFDIKNLSDTLSKNIQDIQMTVQKMPFHHEYIQAHCAADK